MPRDRTRAGARMPRRLRALRGLRERGIRVPEDVSVTGFDDVEWARFCEVPSTTARFPRRDPAEMAVRELIRCVDDGSEAARDGRCWDIVLTPELVVRQSTGAAFSPPHPADRLYGPSGETARDGAPYLASRGA